MNLRLVILTLVAVSLCLAGPIETPLVAVGYPASGSPNGGAYNPSQFSLGFIFHVNSPTTITALGIFDISHPSYPIGTPRIGLWTSAGNLLGSATVTSSDPLLLGISPYQFRYHSITAVNLSAGQDYVLSAQDSYLFNYQLAVTSAPEIAYLGSRVSPDGPGWVFPAPSGDQNGHFGPNALFVPTGVGVPEPATAVTFVLGLILVRAHRRYRRVT